MFVSHGGVSSWRGPDHLYTFSPCPKPKDRVAQMWESGNLSDINRLSQNKAIITAELKESINQHVYCAYWLIR